MGQFGVELGDGTLSYSGRTQPLAGCHAYVDTVGAVRDRATLTRVVGGAVVAGPVGAIVGGLLRKRVDEREFYLFITGEQDWVIPIRQSLAAQARSFAAGLNTAAREQAAFDARFAEAKAEGERQKLEMQARRTNVYRNRSYVDADVVAQPREDSPNVSRRSRAELKAKLGLT